jgi:hypothetical protein
VFLGAGVSTPLFYAEALGEEPLAGIAASVAAVLGQILVAAYGVWRCYHANGGRSGQRFAETFIAIGWVVGLRVFLVATIPFIALFAAPPELPSSSRPTCWFLALRQSISGESGSTLLGFASIARARPNKRLQLTGLRLLQIW